MPPFNNIQARKAGADGDDPAGDHLGQCYGGLGTATENFLPPGYQQYKKITAVVVRPREGEAARATVGHGGQAVDVYGTNEDPSKSSTEYSPGQLAKIGYKPKLHLLLTRSTSRTIGNQATKAQAMFTDWYQDYPHPLDWFDTLLNGNASRRSTTTTLAT
jgi:peptide/nickel transport system substrate-binding protein